MQCSQRLRNLLWSQSAFKAQFVEGFTWAASQPQQRCMRCRESKQCISVTQSSYSTKASVYEIALAEILCAVCSHDAHYITSDQLIMALMSPPVQLFSSNPPQFQRLETCCVFALNQWGDVKEQHLPLLAARVTITVRWLGDRWGTVSNLGHCKCR